MGLALKQITGTGLWDLERNKSDDLRTAITIQLMTHARARDDDPAPDGDRRGWHGDSYPDAPGFVLGSRLWLLEGVKLDADAIARAETYAKEALQVLIDQGAAAAIEIVPERVSDTLLGLAISVQQPKDLAPTLLGVWEIALAE